MNFYIQPGEEDIAPPHSQITAQCHPFSRECRAFARLKEVGKEHLVVKCYGYLEVDAATEQALADQLGLDDWGRDADVWPEWEKQPLHALVKELVPQTEFSRRDAPKMVYDLKEIHRCGIIVNDVMYDAYVGRRLVDLSFAVTAPHIQFDERFRFNDSDPVTPYQDFGCLEDVFRHWNYLHPSKRKITVQADHDLEYSLRSRKEPYEPRDFDWQACANQWTKLSQRSARAKKLGRKRPRAVAKTGRKKKKSIRRSPDGLDPSLGCLVSYDPQKPMPYDPTFEEEASEADVGAEENPEQLVYLEFLE